MRLEYASRDASCKNHEKGPGAISDRGLFRGREIPAWLQLQLHLDHRLMLLVTARRIERDLCGLVA